MAAYRLLLEAALRGGTGRAPVFNVATGTAVSMRWVIEEYRLGLARPPVTVETDPDLVRRDDPAYIAGSHERITALTGWRPTRPLATTIADMVAAMESTSALA